MNIEHSGWFRSALAASLLALAAAPIAAQAPATTAATVVLTTLTIKADVDRAQLLKVMPDEVRATLKRISTGRFSVVCAQRRRGRGVHPELHHVGGRQGDPDAAALENRAGGSTTPLGPLTPLRMLLTDPAPSPKGNQQP
jgi:hypothetical protein